MHAALLIAGKDLRQRLRDRSAILVALVVPLALASIFGLIFHNVDRRQVTFTFGARRPGPRRGRAGVRGAGAAPARAQRPDPRPHRAEPRRGAQRRRQRQGRARRSCSRRGFSPRLGRGAAAAAARARQTSTRRSARRSRESIARSYASRDRHARGSRPRAARPGRRPRLRRLPRRPVALADVSTREPAARRRAPSTRPAWPSSSSSSPSSSGSRASSTSGATGRSRGCSRRRSAAARCSAGKLLTSLVLGIAQHGRARARDALPARRPLGQSARRRDPDRRRRRRGDRGDGARRHARAHARPGAAPGSRWSRSCSAMLGGTFFPVAQAGGLLATLSLATPQAWFLRGIENLAGGAGAGVVLGPAARDPRVRRRHGHARVQRAREAGGA